MKTAPSAKCTQARDRGFTFLELLVVLAVVGLLFLLLLPAVAGTRPNSQAVQCLANLRQMSVAWQMYTADNAGLLAMNGDEGFQPASLAAAQAGTDSQWCPGRMDAGAPTGQPTNSAWLKTGQIYPYLNNLGVYRCPADTSGYLNGAVYPVFGQGSSRVRSLSMNGWINPVLNDVGMDTTDYIVYRKDSDLNRPGPANLWVFIDESPYSINEGLFLELTSGTTGPPKATAWTDIPATYHNGAGGISFADGHAQLRKWTDSVVLNFRSSAASINGEPSNSGDLSWLMNLTTAHE